SLLIRSKNPRRCQAENPLKLLSEFAGPALFDVLRSENGAATRAEFHVVAAVSDKRQEQSRFFL
ncbi:hypothetical protein, partial [Bradyrhizobium liaoningense]